jgi:Uri superfamily endonuclease
MTMQQLKNHNKTDKHIHAQKKRYLEVISRSARFKEFNREKKIATKTSNMFKIVPRIGTCDAGFSSSKFRSSCLPFVVKQTTLPVFS